MVVVTGIGLISALGENLQSNWHNLLLGNSAINLRQIFTDLPCLPVAMIADQPSDLTVLLTNVLDQAIKDANLSYPLLDCAVIIGSSRGYQYVWEKMIFSRLTNEGFLSDDSFLKSLPCNLGLLTAKIIGSRGIVYAPMIACSTGMMAIAQGFDLIKYGQCDRVIVGALDCPISRLTITGFQQMGALAKTGCYPFDRNREGLVLGEGGAIFVLESEDLAKQRNAKIYGQILGYGWTNDAVSANSPSTDIHSASVAVKDCLKRSNIKPDDINYIHCHGTGTKLNDDHEAKIINYLFDHDVFVSSTKGATGHTLGASGALCLAFSLLSLRDNIIPPTVGFNQGNLGLNLMKKPEYININNVLCLSFGFGGQNMAIAVGKSD
jgi:3-oxoacyl-[acyl-carrier-protein] synthase II